ncbi:uncharacterized protein [Halyomorpha halys]|uniref:uncharacterized protein isoform X1 n=1 Tax=Halyomorpha halys TaxID=286706 RepID=UPI000D0C8850|nr:uncharacterized protein LOC106688457 isoform X1 [Halyomorpha halys]
MDSTINDLLGEQNDFEFCDDGTNEASKTSINENSEDEKKSAERKKKTETSDSSLSIKDDEGVKSFNGMTTLFSQLEKNLKLFKNLPELKLIDKYALDLKKKLDRELEELDFTMKETKATIINTRRLKKQRYYVKKELARMTKNLTKVKQEELQEMELVVAVYDKELLRRWHVAKKTTSPHALEGFINNIVPS